jgi:hypothetical protein
MPVSPNLGKDFLKKNFNKRTVHKNHKPRSREPKRRCGEHWNTKKKLL